MKTATATSNDIRHNIIKNGEDWRLEVNIRLNDECENGHEDFSVTGSYRERRPGGRFGNRNNPDECGCIHERILKHCPELKPLIDLHLSDWNGYPMHALANGFYHAQNNLEHLMSHMRCNEAQADELAKAEDKDHFAYIAYNMGFIEQWNKEAAEGIKMVEAMTGQTFESKATRNQLNMSVEDLEALSFKANQGYWKPVNVAKRKAAKLAAQKKAFIKKVEERRANEIEKANIEAALTLSLFEVGIPSDNWIYYNHTNTLKFNWADHRAVIAPEIIHKALKKVDKSKWPKGIKVEH